MSKVIVNAPSIDRALKRLDRCLIVCHIQNRSYHTGG
jgi:hypothetical protein